MTTRRDLIVALGAGVFAAPFASFAQQQGKVWRVGFLSQRARPATFDCENYGAFLRGMQELGYVEGKNLMMEWRFANGNLERLPVLAMQLVQLKVDIIVSGSTPTTRAAQKATNTIPIVMGTVGDAVESGFVIARASDTFAPRP